MPLLNIEYFRFEDNFFRRRMSVVFLCLYALNWIAVVLNSNSTSGVITKHYPTLLIGQEYLVVYSFYQRASRMLLH